MFTERQREEGLVEEILSRGDLDLDKGEANYAQKNRYPGRYEP